MRKENDMIETYKVKVPHAPLQDVILILSLDWQPSLSRYTVVVETLHAWPFGIPEPGRGKMLKKGKTTYLTDCKISFSSNADAESFSIPVGRFWKVEKKTNYNF